MVGRWGMGAHALVRGFFVLITIWGSGWGAVAFGTTHLFLSGGGELPAEMTQRLAKAAGGKSGNILMITWSTDDPPGDVQWLTETLTQAVAANDRPTVVASITYDQVKNAKTQLVDQIKNATAIFFDGGVQDYFMNVLADPQFADVTALIRSRFENEGLPIAGTSAGTAIMSVDMFDGTENPEVIDPTQRNLTRPGLGLLRGVMVDTHFVIRQRENRLFSYLAGHRKVIGMGIDQDGAVEVTDGAIAEVLGNKLVMIVEPSIQPGDYSMKFLNDGDLYDLARRRRV